MSGKLLVDLGARFVRHSPTGLAKHDTLAGAQGLLFECPKCGGHKIIVWFRDRGVPDAAMPTPRWGVAGTSIANITLSPSIDAGADCWHGHVVQGLATL